MAEQMTNYQCPACNGSMHFDANLGKLQCDYCDSIYGIDEIKEYYAQLNAEVVEDAQSQEPQAPEEEWGEGAENMKAYRCSSCGAELVTDATTAATSCPYCGNPTIIPQQFTGMMRPRYVIPFSVDKKKATDSLREYYKGKICLPKSFSEGNHLEEIKGVYVPFWLYSASVDANLAFEGHKIHTHRSGNTEIREDEIFDVRRHGVVAFEQIPTDASSKMPDDLMDSIEPFDYSGLKDFEMEYLPGYLADKYDVDRAECAKKAKGRAVASTISAIGSTVTGYSSHSERQMARRIRVQEEKQDYAMLPVWLLSTKWNNENFLFAINGQTGKMIGDLPIDQGKRWLCSLPVPILILLLSFYFGRGGNALIIGAVIALVAFFLIWSTLTNQMKPVGEATMAHSYLKSVPGGVGTANAVRMLQSDDIFVRKDVSRHTIQSAGNGPRQAGPGGPGGPGPR